MDSIKLFEKISEENLGTLTLEEVIECKFEDTSKAHNWENYVDDYYKEDWENLPLDSKVIIYGFASASANIENWD